MKVMFKLNQEIITIRELIPHIGLIPKVVPLMLHSERFQSRNSQEGLERDNRETRILFKWKGHAVLYAFVYLRANIHATSLVAMIS